MPPDPNKVTYFAETDSRNQRIRFGIKAKDRTRHMYVIGKTGMGKSTLLENLAIQDIQNGSGLAVIDPHGSFADKLLDYVPEHRIKDVLYFAPFDMDYPVSFNVMEDVGADKRHLVANGLMSAFKKIWVDAWSARMEYILNNTILALLEYPDSTLIAVNRMLADKDYRKKVVDYITDPSVKAFWTDEFANYTERMAAEATPAIQNKIGQFISNPIIRNIIGQPKSTFDFREAMDTQKIVIINLSKGRIGEASAQLLGAILVTKIYLAAMSRADLNEANLKASPNFYLFVDEFQSFANESFADILSEARKYNLNLTIAHQYIEQMPEEVRAAVFGNVGTMIAFRVGAIDGEVLEKEFAPQFMSTDLVNLGFAQIYLKLMIDGVSSQPFSASTMAPLPRPEVSFREQIIASSRATFAEPREKVEDEIRRWHLEGRIEKPEKKSGGQGSGAGGQGGQGAHGAQGHGGHGQAGGGARTHSGSPQGQSHQGPPYSQMRPVSSGAGHTGHTAQRTERMERTDRPERSERSGGDHQRHERTDRLAQSERRPDSAHRNTHTPQQQSTASTAAPRNTQAAHMPEGATNFKQAFATIQREEITPAEKREAQQKRERELRAAVSLSSLKSAENEDAEREKKKELTAENADALRSLLGQVLGQAIPVPTAQGAVAAARPAPQALVREASIIPTLHAKEVSAQEVPLHTPHFAPAPATAPVPTPAPPAPAPTPSPAPEPAFTPIQPQPAPQREQQPNPFAIPPAPKQDPFQEVPRSILEKTLKLDEDPLNK